VKAHRHPEKYARWLQIHTTIKELLRAWVLRIRNIHHTPPEIIRLSMMMFFTNYPQLLWHVLSSSRFSLSYNTTLTYFEKANAIPLPIRLHWP
jgi:hypothetical protein